MTPMRRLSVTTSLALGLAGPAMADVTPQQVWDSWKSTGARMGQSLSAENESLSGDTLSLSDVVVAMVVEDGTLSGTIPSVEMTDLGDGTVSVTMSPDYDMTMEMRPSDDEPVDLTIRVSMPDMRTVASGTPDAVSYTLDGPTLAMSLMDVTVDGDKVDLSGEVSVNDLSGSYTLSDGDDADLESSITAARLDVALEGNDLGEQGSGLSLQASFTDVSTTISTGGQGFAAMAEPGGLFTEGVSIDTGYSHLGSTFVMEIRDPESGTVNWSSENTGGDLNTSIDDGLIDYTGNSKNVKVTLSGDAIPFPQVEAAMDEFGFALSGPVAKTETPEDFGLLVNMAGLTVSDFLWAMLDPGAALPRDPATLVIDLAGKATMLTNLADQDAVHATETLGELHALDLNTLRLSIAGAELTGDGAFTFDNADTTTFDGFPAPDGAVDLQLTGGNALLDTLVRMGLVPEQQAMGARMMMGLFAVPAGDDTMSSRIEVRPDGSVSANGQRIR